MCNQHAEISAVFEIGVWLRIRSRRLQLAGHMVRAPEEREIYKVPTASWAGQGCGGSTMFVRTPEGQGFQVSARDRGRGGGRASDPVVPTDQE